MKIEILYCPGCWKYTTSHSCPDCHSICKTPKPPKFSIEDPYGQSRLKYKKLHVYKV